jgi:uncharacterized protein DUF3105
VLAPAERAQPCGSVLKHPAAATLTAVMSSRQEEKEKRRREREERERAERTAASRRKRLQFVFGGVLSVLIVAGVVALAAGAFSGSGDSGSGPTKPKGGAAIPGPQEADLKKAAAAASCKLVDAPIEGTTHEDKDFKASDYKTNPPTSGNHNPVWYQDGEYNPGDTPKLGMIVHPLEHGRIELQYKPGTPAKTVSQLETLFNESSNGYHMLLFQNTTGMPFAVAAAAWGHYVGCPAINDKVFDALRDFREAYIDKGREVVQ